MSAIKKFEEFVKSNIARKQSPDKSRSEFLVSEAERSYNSLHEMIKKLEVSDAYANNYIKESHDILMELIRAKMLIDGYNASGFGAHEAEISYLRLLGFSENDVQFADQLRFFRNGMMYYGTRLDKEYALKVIKFLEIIYPKLRRILKNSEK